MGKETIPVRVEVSKVFSFPPSKYEPAHRMCRSGQRRAAHEGYLLLNSEDPDEIEEIYKRAKEGEAILNTCGYITDHRKLISLVVVRLRNIGRLTQYVDANGEYIDGMGNLVDESGEFLSDTTTSSDRKSNILHDLVNGAVMF